MTLKLRTAEDVRREIAEHLVAIAGPVPAGTSTKEIFRRLEGRLAHPEINGRMVKALWYREVKNIPAHIADHVRSQIEAKPQSAFIIDEEGRIRSAPSAPLLAPIRCRLEATRINLEVSPMRAPFQGVATLRHWLLSLLTEPRPFRLTDLDRGTVVELSGALATLDRLEEMLGASRQSQRMIEGPAMIADEVGVRPLDSEALARLGVHPEADYDVPAFLARNMGVVAILQQGQELQVLARASERPTRALDHAANYLSLRTEPVRLGIWWSNSWLREKNPDGHAAAQRLRRLASLEAPNAPLPSYVADRVRLDDVPARELAPFKSVLSLIGRQFDSDAIGALLAAGAGDRLTVVESSPEGPRMVYHPYGPDYYGSAWALQAVGKVIRNQPDRDYGAAVEQRYAESLRDNVIHFERVRATIRETNQGSPGDRRRSSYSRLIVPLTDGRRRLAVAYIVLTRQPEATG